MRCQNLHIVDQKNIYKVPHILINLDTRQAFFSNAMHQTPGGTYDFSPICSICLRTVGLSSHAFAVKHRSLHRKLPQLIVPLDDQNYDAQLYPMLDLGSRLL